VRFYYDVPNSSKVPYVYLYGVVSGNLCCCCRIHIRRSSDRDNETYQLRAAWSWVRLGQSVKAHQRWILRSPGDYRSSVLGVDELAPLRSAEQALARYDYGQRRRIIGDRGTRATRVTSSTT